MKEEVDLHATGYKWKCPECGRSNSSRSATERVVCRGCNATIEVEGIEHNIAPIDGIKLIAAGYVFKCPACYERSNLPAATERVVCKKCKMETRVKLLKHHVREEETHPSDCAPDWDPSEQVEKEIACSISITAADRAKLSFFA